MYLFRFRSAGDGSAHVGIEDDEGGRYDLTLVQPDTFGSVSAWLAEPDPVGAALLALSAARDARRAGGAFLLPPDVPLLAPIDPTQEVWASGVTYERSKVARMEESKDAGGGDFYDRVYDAERPELFFKALGRRVSGPGGPVRVRRDSSWDVPEPEMTLVLSAGGALVGLTVGNDMSSRSIEGENPLYLPQAKTYDGACALGPRIRLLGVDGAPDPAALPITLEIVREGQTGFRGETSTGRMRRRPEELSGFLLRELSFPDGAFLMTGTGIVPPDTFTLRPGDEVRITVEGVGTLTNTVE
jgi:2-dehydro-3-deoxy-D-arabinonate dehydratase